MTPERWQKIESVFQQALALNGQQRGQYLDGACLGDVALRAEVESLLQADAASSNDDQSALSAMDTTDLESALHAWQAPPDERKNMSKRCERGHFYDPSKHLSCPHCGIPELAIDLGKTVPMSGPEPAFNPAFRQAGLDQAEAARTGPDSPRTQPRGVADEGTTVGYLKSKIGLEPVVGWLVCIDGPDKGRDYRIKSQRNFIGRDPKMDICIPSDEQVSRENHAVISYDPRNNGFKLVPGDSRGITYLGGESVDFPVALKAYDLVEIGRSKLLFVPFCSEKFRWQ